MVSVWPIRSVVIPLIRVDTQKYLGVYIDSKLNITNVCSKLRRVTCYVILALCNSCLGTLTEIRFTALAVPLT